MFSNQLPSLGRAFALATLVAACRGPEGRIGEVEENETGA
jgi:hypothetical protein